MVYSPMIDSIWSADLIILNRKEYVQQHENYKYILCVMDVFSRYAWVKITKNKDKITISDAFENIIKQSGRKCKRLWTDNGGEFYQKFFENMLKNIILNDIQHNQSLKQL